MGTSENSAAPDVKRLRAEKIRARVAHVRDSLAKIASGELILPGAAENLRGQGFSTVACDDPVFTRETMKGY